MDQSAHDAVAAHWGLVSDADEVAALVPDDEAASLVRYTSDGGAERVTEYEDVAPTYHRRSLGSSLALAAIIVSVVQYTSAYGRPIAGARRVPRQPRRERAARLEPAEPALRGGARAEVEVCREIGRFGRRRQLVRAAPPQVRVRRDDLDAPRRREALVDEQHDEVVGLQPRAGERQREIWAQRHRPRRIAVVDCDHHRAPLRLRPDA